MLWGRAYALSVPDMNVTYASGFAVSARVQQAWARTNSSAVSGLFSLRVESEPASGRVEVPLHAWAYRSAAGMHAAVQLGGMAAHRIQLPPCPPGVWTTTRAVRQPGSRGAARRGRLRTVSLARSWLPATFWRTRGPLEPPSPPARSSGLASMA